MSRWTRKQSRKGLTLIEMMICFVILGILAAMAVPNLRASRRKIELRSALLELQRQDGLMRRNCRQLAVPGQLVFDLKTGQVKRVDAKSPGHPQEFQFTSLSGGARVEQVRTTSPRRMEQGVIRVDCGASGHTPTYAVLVSSGDSRQWIVVSGLTGKFESVDNDAAIQDIFHKLALE